MSKLQWMVWYPASRSRTNYESRGQDNSYTVVQRRNLKVYLYINNRLAAECKSISDAEIKAQKVEDLRL